MPGRDLIDRHPRLEIGALGRLHVHASQERSTDAPVSARGFARERDTGLVVQTADHDETITKRLERLQYRRHCIAGALGGGRPALHHCAVADIDDAQAAYHVGLRFSGSSECRHHSVQQRQRNRRADPLQDRAPRDCLLRDDHGSDLLI